MIQEFASTVKEGFFTDPGAVSSAPTHSIAGLELLSRSFDHSLLEQEEGLRVSLTRSLATQEKARATSADPRNLFLFESCQKRWRDFKVEMSARTAGLSGMRLSSASIFCLSTIDGCHREVTSERKTSQTPDPPLLFSFEF